MARVPPLKETDSQEGSRQVPDVILIWRLKETKMLELSLIFIVRIFLLTFCSWLLLFS